MEKQTCPFGPAFRRERKANDLSQWTIAMRLHNHLRNIQRIESGAQQPGVTLALRLIEAAEANPGEFLLRLWEESTGEGCVHHSCVEVAYENPPAQPGIKTLYGPLLFQARKAVGLSQTAMAKKADYNLRNINAVEKGLQEPGIMAALTLVGVTGVDIKNFFNKLFEFETATNL